MTFVARVRSMVAFEHTIFALPFAFAGAILGADHHGVPLTAAAIAWITVAMAGARTLAMVLNRLLDARIDAANPRTSSREIPSGAVRPGQAIAVAAASAAALAVSLTQLHPVVRWLWPIPVAMFLLYPFTKRFTWLCHLVLGLTVGMAAPAAWVAVSGAISVEAVILWLGIALWVGGFDLIYATQDVDFDRSMGLHSIPARFGIGAALTIARVCHVGTVLLLAVAGWGLGLGAAYWATMVVVAAVLWWEHSIVAPDDLSRVDKAFFTANGYVGIAYFAGVFADRLLGS